MRQAGAKVSRSHHASLGEAIDALEARMAELEPAAEREEVRFLSRRIEPADQVAARLELSGPGGWAPTVRGGVDLRGDGSAEAYTGRVRRTIVSRAPGESAAAALRRALGGGAPAT